MNKLITVTFEFDVATETVSKLNCLVDGVVSKKTSTKSKSKEIVLEDKALITLEANKIQLNNRAASIMGVEWKDRIIIKYEKDSKNKFFPLITLGEEDTGNQVTKTNSITYRGKVNTVLREYGVEFELEPFKEGVWKLVSTTQVEAPVKKEVKKEIEVKEDILDVTILTDEKEEEDIDIQEMTFKLM